MSRHNLPLIQAIEDYKASDSYKNAGGYDSIGTKSKAIIDVIKENPTLVMHGKGGVISLLDGNQMFNAKMGRFLFDIGMDITTDNQNLFFEVLVYDTKNLEERHIQFMQSISNVKNKFGITPMQNYAINYGKNMNAMKYEDIEFMAKHFKIGEHYTDKEHSFASVLLKSKREEFRSIGEEAARLHVAEKAAATLGTSVFSRKRGVRL